VEHRSGYAPDLADNVRQGWKGLPGANTLAYLSIVSDEQKKFYFCVCVTCGQCYKTFYDRKL